MTPEEREELEADAAFSRAVALRFGLVLAGLIALVSLLGVVTD